MSIHYTAETFAEALVTKKVKPFEVKVERSFDLPPVLHGATIGLYFAFIAVMALAFQDPELFIPMAICVVYLVMAFGVPAMWKRMKPDHASRTADWAEFSRLGINTYTGNMSARDATGQVLILPVLIFAWGMAIALIVAIVR